MNTSIPLSYADFILIFTALGDYYKRCDQYTRTDEFFKIRDDRQTTALEIIEMNRDLYERMAIFLTQAGDPLAETLYHLDTDHTPRKDVS